MTSTEAAKLTCLVLDRIFASYGKWNVLAIAAAGKPTVGLGAYRLPEHVRQNLKANNWESGLCIAIAEHYLPTLAPLDPHHASGAMKIVEQDYYSWSREAIAREPEGPEHLALLDALRELETQIGNCGAVGDDRHS